MSGPPDATRPVVAAARAVAPPDGAVDPTVWRTVGDPLVEGAADGPLRGLRVAVKDLFAVAGHRVGAGNPTWLRDAVPEPAHASAVAALLRGGARVRGIAHTDELAYSIVGDNVHHGTPPNGAVAGAVPGGSSSGPASAVATGQADVGLGTDTGGSVRVPASWQGLWGLRTTHGLVPRAGMLPLAPSFDTVGWLTRDGETLEAVARWCLSAVGPAPGGTSVDGRTVDGQVGPVDRSTADGSTVVGASAGAAPALGHGGPRAVALPGAGRQLLVPVETVDSAWPAVAAAFTALCERWHASGPAQAAFAQAGPASGGSLRVEPVHVGALDAWFEAFRTVQAAEAWRHDGPWVSTHPGALGPALAARFAAAAAVTSAEESAARRVLAALRADLRAVVARGVVLLPTTPGPAPSRDAAPEELERVRAATLRSTALAGVAGLPAVSVPLLTVDTPLGPAPVGVCLVGPAGSDLALVRAARALAASQGRR